MKTLIKPQRLAKGDKIAAISPCNGWAGDSETNWKYNLGVSRLQEIGLQVVAAPNSMRGSDFLSKNPQARAEDIMWAFENHDIDAIIANVGGNDSIKIIPYIDPKVILSHAKIFIGYSDVMNIHLLCYQCGLSSFYGDNLFHPIADQSGWHPYSKKWFLKTLFDARPVGEIEPSPDWTFEPSDHLHAEVKRTYYPNDGYRLIQGTGTVTGRLIGGHTGLMELEGSSIELKPEDYEGAILFVEDIPDFFDEAAVSAFFHYLGKNGILRKLNGIIIGRANEDSSFAQRSQIIREIAFGMYSCSIPILYGLNFGHSSPIFILPYGALAEINCENKRFSILESGVTTGKTSQA